jgi:hypothetical protein
MGVGKKKAIGRTNKEKWRKSYELSWNQHKSPYITRDELKSIIKEVLTTVQSSNKGSVQKNKNSVTCYRCGEQGHYACSCTSEKTLKDNQNDPRAYEFKQTLKTRADPTEL